MTPSEYVIFVIVLTIGTIIRTSGVFLRRNIYMKPSKGRGSS